MKKLRPGHGESGQAMIVVAFLAVGFSLISALGMTHFSASILNSGSFLDRKQAFYAAEGALNTATIMIENYMNKNSVITQQTLQSALDSPASGKPLSNLMPPGFALSSDTVDLISSIPQGPIPTGPWAGIQSPLTTVRITVGISSSTGHFVGSVSSELTIANVYPFQFLEFSVLSDSGWYPTVNMNLQGRVHVNGNACFGSSATLQLATVTSSGEILWGGDPSCAWPQPSGGATMISTNANYLNNNLPFNFFQLQANNESGCTNCGNGPMAWPAYDILTWNTNVEDSANGVGYITFPGFKSSTPVQPGYNGDQFGPAQNTDLMRYEIDPIFPGETTPTSSKFAMKANLRIVDGVWYVPDPLNSQNWPGIAIWSDKPGAADDAFGNAVGQDDIRAHWNGTPNQWSAAGPQLFSYYQYQDGLNSIAPNPTATGTPVISYGGLTPYLGSWSPGTLVVNAPGTGNPICNGEATSCTSASLFPALNQACNCTGGPPIPPPSAATYFLDGARSGFVDPHYYNQGKDPTSAQILPVNFDVDAFATAMLSTVPGELGSYFGQGAFAGAFKGIVYITASWPGSASTLGQQAGYNRNFGQGTGVGVGSPEPPAFYGAGIPIIQSQKDLPYQLCSNSTVGAHPGKALQPYDQVLGGQARFVIPDCAAYGTNGLTAYPNAVRFFNGSHFNRPLSLVTNLPAYVMGNYNTISVTTSSNSLPWYQSMIGGDFVTVLSNSWTDAATNGWNSVHPHAPTVATSTTYNAAFWSGYLRRTGSTAFEGLPGIMEDWSNSNLTATGSFVFGFYPVYRITGQDPSVYVLPASQQYNYDPHFGLPGDQPPGTPAFWLTGISTFNGN